MNEKYRKESQGSFLDIALSFMTKRVVTVSFVGSFGEKKKIYCQCLVDKLCFSNVHPVSCCKKRFQQLPYILYSEWMVVKTRNWQPLRVR